MCQLHLHPILSPLVSKELQTFRGNWLSQFFIVAERQHPLYPAISHVVPSRSWSESWTCRRKRRCIGNVRKATVASMRGANKSPKQKGPNPLFESFQNKCNDPHTKLYIGKTSNQDQTSDSIKGRLFRETLKRANAGIHLSKNKDIVLASCKKYQNERYP